MTLFWRNGVNGFRAAGRRLSLTLLAQPPSLTLLAQPPSLTLLAQREDFPLKGEEVGRRRQGFLYSFTVIPAEAEPRAGTPLCLGCFLGTGWRGPLPSRCWRSVRTSP
jgi:hypothetical protein